MNDLIVFVHRGESWYLYYTVKQARAYHPDAEIILLSDVPHPDLARYATVVPIVDYFEDAAAFSRSYQHFSTNEFEYERFCFQRWFVINEYIRHHPAARIIHLDSDLLVFDDLTADFARLGNAAFALVGHQGPCSMLFPDPRIIQRFCARITRLFTEEQATLAPLYLAWRKDGRETAVSDMHALHTFVSNESLHVVDLGALYEGTGYDGGVNAPEGYSYTDGYKVLQWPDGRPYAFNEKEARWVRLKTLHCQGNAKARILEYFTAKDVAFWLDRAMARVRARTRRHRLPSLAKA